MPSALVSTEIVVGTLLVIVAAVLAVTYLRRRYIAGGLPLTLCGLRDNSGDRWRVGLLRLGDGALEWYSLGGLSLRARRRWQRQTLLLEAPTVLGRGDSPSLLPGASGVACTDGEQAFQLALQRPDYMAVRSWQEAAPPGYNVNVA